VDPECTLLFHISLPLVPIQSQMNPVYALQSLSVNLHFGIVLMSRSSKWSLFFGFSQQFIFFFHSTDVSCILPHYFLSSVWSRPIWMRVQDCGGSPPWKQYSVMANDRMIILTAGCMYLIPCGSWITNCTIMRCLNAVSVQFTDTCKFPVLALSPVEDVTLVVLKSYDITANIKMLINHTIESVISKAVRKQFWYFLAQISDATAF
jgi:hypothetical protein